MSEEIIKAAQREMEQAVVAFRHELAKIRTGRASPALVSSILVNYYGTKTPLQQLAGITAPEPRLLLISPYDQQALREIEKAIMSSDLGLTPVNDGKTIKVPIPELTEERRRELVKHVRKQAEEFRVSVRNHRREANEKLRDLHKQKLLDEDSMRAAENRVQQLTTSFIEKIDQALAAKEKEIMEV